MKKWFFFFLFLLPAISFPQANNFDSSFFKLYSNTIEGISFIYPGSWELSKRDGLLIFRATEYSGDSTDKYRESIFFFKVLPSNNLHDYLNSAAEGIKSQNRKKLSILQKEIKKNENGITYGILKNKAIQKNLTGIKTQVYFDTEKGRFLLVFEHEISESKKYEPIYSAIIESIKIIN